MKDELTTPDIWEVAMDNTTLTNSLKQFKLKINSKTSNDNISVRKQTDENNFFVMTFGNKM